MGRSRDAGVLFSDIAGSSALYEQLGDRPALALIERCCAMQRAVVEDHGGRVVKTIGDEIMAVFGDAGPMVDAAVAMQRRVGARAGARHRARLALRIGLHYGPVIIVESDCFGETVNTAAHVTRVSRAEQILCTREVVDRLDARRREAARDIDYLTVKGRPGGVHAFEVVWRSSAETTVFRPGKAGAPPPAPCRLNVRWCGAERTWDGVRPLTIGRAPENDIVLLTATTSRRHASFDLRGDKWLLVDRSANGTFVQFADKDPFLIHCEEVVLYESGRLGMGDRSLLAGAECVAFALLPA